MEQRRHRIGRTFVLSPLVDALRSPATTFPAIRIAWSALRYFFYPQFETRLRPRKRPFVFVDHPLDERVPFRPDLVAEYLTFFFLWINSALYLSRNFGRRGRAAFRDYILRFSRLYEDCGSVSLACQSPTARPPKAANGLFAIIHGVDPHLHCIPSLHVLIVHLNKRLFARHALALSNGKPDAALRKAIEYVEREATRVTESVLFVKQHSVNCIGVSAFCLRAWYPEFGDEAALDVADSLFTVEGQDLEAADEIRGHIKALYRQLWSEYEKRGDGKCRPVVLDYLNSFEPEPPWAKDPSGRFSLERS